MTSDRAGGRGRTSRAAADPERLATIEREAIRLFGTDSYPVVGIRDISDAVGILPGSLYVHIDSKEALLGRIVESGIQRYLDVLSEIAAGEGTATDRLRAVVHAFAHTLDATFEHSAIAFYQWTYLTGEHRERVIAMRRQYEELYVDLVAAGIATGEFREVRSVRVAVRMLLGTVHSLCHWYSPNGSLSIDVIAEMLADTVVRGLLP
jgi:AcrR family transcriptional regulator